MTEAGLEVGPVEDGELRIALSGEIDLANVATVRTGLLDAIGNELTEVVVDLAGVTYIDSAGLRVLLTLAARLDVLQIRFRLVVPPGAPARRVIELSGIGAVATLQPGADRSPPS